MRKYIITVVVDEDTLNEIKDCPGGIAIGRVEQVATILANGVRSFYDDPVRGGHWQCTVREIQS